jgi:phosphoserine aminotransferase
MSFMPDDFTPTWEEWIHSLFVLPNPYHIITDQSGETGFYTGINFSLLNIQLLLYGTDSVAALRGMYMVRAMPQVFAASALSDAYDAAGGYRVTEESWEVRSPARLTNPVISALGAVVNRLT